MRLVLGMTFWQRRKKWEVDSIYRLQEHSGLIVSCKICRTYELDILLPRTINSIFLRISFQRVNSKPVQNIF